jgi:UDP-N-acetylmuramate dehydrogenase
MHALDIPSLKTNVQLAPYTTYGIGGPADLFVSVTSPKELVHAVVEARKWKVPYFILGCGANILIQDGGIRGLVIHNKADGFKFEGSILTAESGVVVADLIIACLNAELSGLEHFVGIPSTIGGALWQNLHFLSPDRTRTVYVGEILKSAEILNEDNSFATVDKNFFHFGYDDSILHHKSVVVLEASFQLTPSSKHEIQMQMDANMEWRNAKQPQLADFPSCGSIFKKIEGIGAGRLIDQAGLKGTTIGNAQISPKHANYIVNLGGATAQDVIDLIKLVQLEVNRQLGFELEPEITIVGEK